MVLLLPKTIVFFIPGDKAYLSLSIVLLTQFFHMIFIPLLFSSVPDTVDYSLHKTGTGPMAMSFSGHLLSLKFGIAIGGALTGWMLVGYGYEANVQQTEKALDGIIIIFAASPALGALIAYILLNFYKLDYKWSKTMNTSQEIPKKLTALYTMNLTIITITSNKAV
ncbi:MFS transporter [Colwellia maritima]|uniref:MFS transporter n=1 Tax=Colwellia maritima TaxID=2912588 RepID=UPI00237B4F90|nr:MFS transporter [Colwellia maritima]